jgi:hypothetical protein
VPFLTPSRKLLIQWAEISLLIANQSFENVAKFKYLGTKITNPNFIYKKFRVNSIFGMLAIILFKVSKHINTKT